jgi:hypothetical protein
MARVSSLQPGRNQPPQARSPSPGLSRCRFLWMDSGTSTGADSQCDRVLGLDLWPGARRGPGGAALSWSDAAEPPIRFPVETRPVAWAIAVPRISRHSGEPGLIGNHPVARCRLPPTSWPRPEQGKHPKQEPWYRGGRHWGACLARSAQTSRSRMPLGASGSERSVVADERRDEN